MSFVYRGNLLDSETALGNKDLARQADTGKFSEKVPDIINAARKEYGRYFGICGSYHHLKACICRSCPSYSGGTGMFCSRSSNPELGKKEGCLCESCVLFKKFQLEGDYFCLKDEKPEFSEMPDLSPNNYQNESLCTGETRFCVLENWNYR